MADRLSRHGSDLLYGDWMPETFEVDRVDRIADILFGVATAAGLIGYGPLAKRVDTRPDFLGQPLDKVSRRAFDRGEPLWSALVVSRSNRPTELGLLRLGSNDAARVRLAERR